MDIINLIIDNKPVQVDPGTSLLKAAGQAGIKIPTLCYLHLEDLNIENKPGGCRICVVEVKGRKNLAPSCATQCQDGMVVRTNTMRVLNARKTVMELILSDHPFDCLICAKSGTCDLQKTAQDL
ncbi:MAG: 2Fe-2S iron-sulfur cluster-binding protein, partial [Bacteroidia bacterium]|nr:2Fe-2S iron-sulfur cluster-binding protein [Bacteroidia bacterium]